MDPATGSDPFLWDEDRLAKELGDPNSRWASALRKFPDTTRLASKLREMEVDGEVLMTYEDAWGSALFLHEFLQKSLEVMGMRQQMAVKSLVRILKSGSPAYSKWKAGQDAQSQSIAEAAAAHPPATLTSISTNIIEKDPSGSDPSRGTGSSAPTTDVFQADQGPTADDVLAAPGEATARLLGPSSETLSRKRIFDEMEIDDQEAGDPLPEAPAKKKKRIVPAAVTSAVNTNLVAQFFQEETVEHVLRGGHSSQSYLGKVRMNPDEIVMPDPLPFDGAESFVFLPTKTIPIGRRIQVHKAMQHYLIPNGLVKTREPRPDKDDVLPVFGESDDELDEETARQIEEDEAQDARIEARRLQAVSKRFLSEEDVKAALEAAIGSLEQNWERDKLPTLARKANKMWHDARRAGDHKLRIDRARAEADHLGRRLAKLSEHILREKWPNKNDIERQCISLEQTVQDGRYNRWFVEMLSDPKPPPLPSTLPQPRQRAKTTTYDHLEEDEEILSSGSDADGFIDDSEQPQLGEETKGMPERASTAVSPRSRPLTPLSKMSTSNLSTRPSSSRSLSSESGRTMTVVIRTPPQADKLKEPIVVSPPAPPRAVPSKPLPEYDVGAIKDLGVVYWESNHDPKRLLIAILCLDNWARKRDHLFEQVLRHDARSLWSRYMSRLQANSTSASEAYGFASVLNAQEQSFGFDLAKLFDVYLSCSTVRLQRRELREATITRIQRAESSFASFHAFLRSIAPSFATSPGGTTITDSRSDADLSSLEAPHSLHEDGRAADRGSSMVSETSSEPQVVLPEQLSFVPKEMDEDPVDTRSPGKKRRTKPHRNPAAENLRRRTFQHKAELEARRRQLHENLAKDGTVPSDKSRLIINEAKKSDQGFIYVHDDIAPYIKNHQVEGVRFMWNQVVVDSKAQQGCLLAHTMGLGKTMQVITLLVAIAQAAASDDPTISTQVPKHLRESRTLVLCPSGLINNWIDELLRWAPPDLLGPLKPIVSGTNRENELIVGDWASRGGVLVVGYAIFKKIGLQPKMATWLREKPNIVIGDEAHTLKNPKSQVSKAAQDFRTMARIAMTGSPLTNNVLDYYAMIDWVAPNYLADLDEFRREYANPIKEGLYADSTALEKRNALMLLQVLKVTVAPKVHRLGPGALKEQLPSKKEFILMLRLTDVQLQTYSAYRRGVVDDPEVSKLVQGNAKIWSWVDQLSTLLAHPAIFKDRLEQRQQMAGTDKNDDLIELPPRFIQDLLATMLMLGGDMPDISYSWKVVVVMRILELSSRIGDKVLIFSQSLLTLNFLQKLFASRQINYSRLDGSTQTKLRQDQVKNFNSKDGPDVYLISTRAGGIGLNIFGANRVVIFDFKYTPAEEQQAVGRAYRMGQTKPVFVYWLRTEGTYEDTIHHRSVFKMQLASRVVDKKNPIAMSKRPSDYFAEPTVPPQRDLSAFLNQDTVLDGLLQDESLAGAIRNITSTESFEEEEELELTMEESQEAKSLIEQNRLRYQDLNEQHHQQREGLLVQQATAPMMVSQATAGIAGSAVPPRAPMAPMIVSAAATGIAGSASPPRAPMAPMIVFEAMAGIAGSASPPRAPMAPMIASEAMAGIAGLAAPPRVPTQPIVPPQVPGMPRAFALSSQPTLSSAAAAARPPSSAVPFPMWQTDNSRHGMVGSTTSQASPLGSFLRPGATAQPPPPPQAHNPFASVPAPGMSLWDGTQLPGGGMGPVLPDKVAQLVETLLSAYQTLHGSGLAAKQDPRHLIDLLVVELQRHKTHTLERREFIVNLQQSLHNSQRLAIAFLCGGYTPSFLASRNKQGLMELAAFWDGMEDARYLELLKPRQQPDTSKAAIQSSLIDEQEQGPEEVQAEEQAQEQVLEQKPSPSQTNGDATSAQQRLAVEERRKKAHDRLPWLSQRNRTSGQGGQLSTPQRPRDQSRPGDSFESPHIID